MSFLHALHTGSTFYERDWRMVASYVQLEALKSECKQVYGEMSDQERSSTAGRAAGF